jgi:hypothetical protein
MVDLKRNAGKAFNDVEVVLQKCCKMLSLFAVALPCAVGQRTVFDLVQRLLR